MEGKEVEMLEKKLEKRFGDRIVGATVGRAVLGGVVNSSEGCCELGMEEDCSGLAVENPTVGN